MALSAGTRLGPYEILAPLGAGGMGEVYRSRDPRLDREVAIKVLPEQLAADSRALARFEREAKAVAALSHPNILAIHDIGADSGINYIVMELLEGETLRGRLTRGPLGWQKAVEISTAVAEGLDAAHGKGIIHRDLKPENLFLTSAARVTRYRVYRRGALAEEPTDITHLWRKDLVAFLLGCSFSFESAMQRAGLPVRHLEQRCNVPMFRTNLPCAPAGPFRGPLVVTMRPLTPAQAIEAVVITSRYPQAHGTPIHFGDPGAIGISNLTRPDFGDAVTVRVGEVPVFWACGVTPQAVLMEAKPEFVITHSPGCMFVTDRLAENMG